MSRPEVSVILANRNDLQMLLVTVISAVEDLKGIRGEIVLVDNSEVKYWEMIDALLAGQVKDGLVRIIHKEEPSGAAAMELAAREAKGRYLFYTDSHTWIGSGTIPALLDFYRRHEGEPIAFCHAPIQWAHHSKGVRKVSMRLHENAMGTWGRMPEHECKIVFKGMPHMIPTDVYHAIGGYGCLAEHHVGWGGLIPYLGWKPWLLGYENWGIPQGVAYHFGEYPPCCREEIKYRIYRGHGRYGAGRSHAVAAYVIGGEKFLTEQFEPANMGRWFKGGLTEAIQHARHIGEAEREWMLEHQVRDIYDLLADPPWGKDF